MRERAVLFAVPPETHFDAKAFKPNGEPKTTSVSGRHSNLTTEQAEQIAFLMKVVRVAEKDLDDYLYEHGYKTDTTQSHVKSVIRKGWRPRKK